MYSNGIVQGYEDERYITQATMSNGQLILVDNISNKISTQIRTALENVTFTAQDGILSITDAGAVVHTVATNYAVIADKPYVALAAGWAQLATLSSANTITIDTINEATPDAGVNINNVLLKNGVVTAEQYKLTDFSPAASSSAGTQLGYEGFVKGVGSSSSTNSYILPAAVVGAQIWITNNEVGSAGSFVVRVQNADSTTGERINSVLSEVSIPVHHHARFTCVTEDSHNNNRNRCNWICELYSVNGIGAPGVSEGFRSGARIYTSNASGAAVKVLKVPQANYTAFVAEVTVHVNGNDGCAAKESKFIWRVSQCAGVKNRNVSEVWTTTSMDMSSGNRTIASIAGIASEETIEAVDHEVLTITATHGGAVNFSSDYHVTWRALSMDTRILNYSDPNV